MDKNQIIPDVKQKFQASLGHFKEDVKKLRTGRAHPSMLDGIVVEAYGTPMPLNQLATISTPEAQLIQISPFDPSNIQVIASTIRDDQSLGLSPVDDGRVIRIPIPPLTSERRQQIVKQLHEKVENCMISMRGIRHESLKSIEQLKRDKAVSEDESSRLEKQIDELMSSQKAEIDTLTKSKEADITSI